MITFWFDQLLSNINLATCHRVSSVGATNWQESLSVASIWREHMLTSTSIRRAIRLQELNLLLFSSLLIRNPNLEFDFKLSQRFCQGDYWDCYWYRRFATLAGMTNWIIKKWNNDNKRPSCLGTFSLSLRDIIICSLSFGYLLLYRWSHFDPRSLLRPLL